MEELTTKEVPYYGDMVYVLCSRTIFGSDNDPADDSFEM